MGWLLLREMGDAVNLSDVEVERMLDSMGELWLAYHIGDPTDDGTGAPSAGLLDRVAAGLGPAAARARTNTADVVSAAGSTVAETISHVSLWTAAAGGSCSWFGPVAAPTAVAIGEKVRLLAGELVVDIT